VSSLRRCSTGPYSDV